MRPAHTETDQVSWAAESAKKGFPRAARLLASGQFLEALRERPRHRSSLFVIHVKKNSESALLRLGLVVPKRFESRAARRNLVRRVWREAFRVRRERMERIAPGHDIVVRLVAKLPGVALPVLRQICLHDTWTLFSSLQDRFEKSSAISPCVPPSLS